MRTFAYIRASTADQKNTPAIQAASIEAFAREHKLPEIRHDRIYRDIDVCRGTSAFARPAFSAMLKQVTRDDAIIVAHLDRLGEGERNMIVLANVLADLGVSLFSASGTTGDDLATDTTLTNLVLLMQGFGARHERSRIRDRLKRTMEYLKTEGRPRNGNALPGMQKIRKKDRKGRDLGARFVPHAEELRQIQQIMRWYGNGWTIKKCWHKLDELGWKTKYGVPWSYRRVCRTVRAYEGKSTPPPEPNNR